MNARYQPDPDLEKRLSGGLLDVFIRAGLVFAMAVLCYQVFSPFLSLMAWALILAVALYPIHQKLANRMGGRQGLAATLLVLSGAAQAAPDDPWVAYVANSVVNRDGRPSPVILRVDPVTGETAAVSRNGAQGDLFRHPYDIAVAPGGAFADPPKRLFVGG